MQIRLLFPTDHSNCVWICSLCQVVLCCRTKREQRWRSSDERINEVIKALYTYTHTHSAQDVTAIEAELREEVQLRTQQNAVVRTQNEQQKANKALKTVYREWPIYPACLRLFCDASIQISCTRRVKRKRKKWDEDQPENW